MAEGPDGGGGPVWREAGTKAVAARQFAGGLAVAAEALIGEGLLEIGGLGVDGGGLADREVDRRTPRVRFGKPVDEQLDDQVGVGGLADALADGIGGAAG